MQSYLFLVIENYNIQLTWIHEYFYIIIIHTMFMKIINPHWICIYNRLKYGMFIDILLTSMH